MAKIPTSPRKNIGSHALAVANNDIALVAWSYDSKIKDCLGFAIYRTDMASRTEVPLPAWVGFKGTSNPNWQPKTTEVWPIQKFNWKDLTAKRGGMYQYRIVPMTGAPGSLTPLQDRALTTNPIHISPNQGAAMSYFNRGILSTQFVSHQLAGNTGKKPSIKVLKDRIDQPKDTLRLSLAGDMCDALPALLARARENGGHCYCALYELNDTELLQHLIGATNVHIILSNAGDKGSDSENEPARQSLKDSNVDVTDRLLTSGHIGHNKFIVYVDSKDVPQAVLTGSTNWTSNGMCAQTNNTIIIESQKVAKIYMDYWNRQKADSDRANTADDPKQLQGLDYRKKNAQKIPSLTLEDDSATIDIWFSPNTQQKHKPKEPAMPVDMSEVRDAILGARQAVIFLAFQPGSPSIIDYIVEAEKANPLLFVRGAVTAPQTADDYIQKLDAYNVDLYHHSAGKPETLNVIAASAINDQFDSWQAELLSAGHAIIHDKIVVIDPFTDNCTVIMGSHNLGYAASYNNDENMLIIRGHRGLAEAYAAHVMDVYDHYRFRKIVNTNRKQAFSMLHTEDSWQDKYFDHMQDASNELHFWSSARESFHNATPKQHAKHPKATVATTGGPGPMRSLVKKKRAK